MSGALTDTSIVAGASGAGAYTIDQSLRFNDGDNGRLTRTPSSAGDRRTFTISCWAKVGSKFAARTIFGDAGADKFAIHSDYLALILINGSIGYYTTQYTGLFLDPAAWYHIVYVVDTTQATDTDRLALYLNGVKLTPSGTPTYPSQNAETGVNNNALQEVGAVADAEDYDGYLAEFYLIDGQALTADSFGETNEDTNQWIPKKYVGTYGTNGFYQKYDGQMDGFTKLLLHCDGANDGTTFTDSSPSAHTMTANGDAHTDTAVKKFGTAAMQLDGTGDSVSTPDSTDWDFGDGDWTIEAWIYPDTLSGEDSIYQQYDSDTNKCQMWRAGSNISFHANASGTHRILCVTPTDSVTISTWQHVAVVAFNKTVKIFIDGVSQTLSITLGANPYSGAMPNVASVLGIGGNGNEYTQWQGYLDEVRVSKGVARYHSNFTVATEPFSNATLGTDSSGNNNDYTPYNIGITDQMLDSPTNNFCTLNPLIRPAGAVAYTEGNLQAHPTAAWDAIAGTIGVSSGKWYWEQVTVTQYYSTLGIVGDNASGWFDTTTNPQTGTGFILYAYNGNKEIDNVTTAYGASFTSNDIIGVALNMDDSEVTFYKNNATQGAIAFSGTIANAAMVMPGVNLVGGSPNPLNEYNFNAGQDSSFAGNFTPQGNQDGNSVGDFYYEPPAGYLALCTSNLPDPAIALPGDNFNTILRDGTYPSGGSFTGVGFQPDFSWQKPRNLADSHYLVDAVRGVSKIIKSDTTGAEGTDANYITSFDSDGFTVGSNDWETSVTVVSWNWKASNAASVTNDSGTIDSEVMANTAAGFSIITWSGNSTSNATIGHGLTQVPELFISKALNNGTDYWAVYGKPLGQGYLALNDTGAYSSGDDRWGTNAPTASVMNLGYAGSTNTTDRNYVGYCFHSVEGYSKIGTYTGNGNADGTFIYTGFRPAYTMTKNIASAEGYTGWTIQDVKRKPYNIVTLGTMLAANTSYIEGKRSEGTASTLDYYDIFSNGFKMRGTGYEINQNAAVYLYIAFAESPFKTANAR